MRSFIVKTKFLSPPLTEYLQSYNYIFVSDSNDIKNLRDLNNQMINQRITDHMQIQEESPNAVELILIKSNIPNHLTLRVH